MGHYPMVLGQYPDNADKKGIVIRPNNPPIICDVFTSQIILLYFHFQL